MGSESNTLLLIEDDEAVGLVIQRILSRRGYVVEFVTSGREGTRLATEKPFDGILLDLGLGDVNGMTVLRELRRNHITTPVLVITGDGAESSIVQALDAGADAYVVKPVRTEELAARVRALARRKDWPGEAQQLVAGNVALNRLTRLVQVGGTPLSLSPREFALLEYFLLHSGEVMTREQLLRDVWGTTFDPGTNVVDVHVGRLRRKIAGAGASIRIEARRGEGFVLADA